MDVPVGAIINISGKIAEYFGLIEGVGTKVTKLLHQSFISAKMNLEYARNASGQNQIDYIKEAKTKFIEAVAVEENENKVLALVGLAMCQYYINDCRNAFFTTKEITTVQLTKAELTKYKCLDAARFGFGIQTAFIAVCEEEGPFVGKRKWDFELFQYKMQNWCEKIVLPQRLLDCKDKIDYLMEEKIKAIKMNNFELAASIRDKEQELRRLYDLEVEKYYG